MSEPPEPGKNPRRRLAATAFAALLLSGAGDPPGPPAHTPGLVDRVRVLERAAIHGDFETARYAATWLAEHSAPSPLPPGTLPLAGRVPEAAAAVARATDVAGTVVATADLVASCGGCHEAARVTPAFPRAAPSAFGSIAGHMVRHLEAADLLLEGLVVPSAVAWTRGTSQLREAPLRASDFPVSERIGALMADIETRTHAQADEASRAADAPSRTRAYGRLLARCAECHTRHTTLWDPQPR